jgi:hypothetical protein
MLPLPRIQDIRTYLSDNAWQQSTTWRGASVWSHEDGYEVLVPSRDDLADTGLRVRELLTVLTTVEQRPADDIVVDISAPLDDVQSYRTFPEDMPSGFTSLDAGIEALQAVKDMIGLAARTVVEGPSGYRPTRRMEKTNRSADRRAGNCTRRLPQYEPRRDAWNETA